MVCAQEELLPVEVGSEMAETQNDGQQLSTGDTIVPLWSAEGTAVVGDDPLPLRAFLRQYSPHTRVAGIGVHDKRKLQVWVGQHRCLNQCRSEPIKCHGTVLTPVELPALLCELVEGACNGSKVLDEPPVV